MIFEALQHFFFNSPKHIKDLGYVRETIAIEARYERCQKFWTPHLGKCKEHILKAAEELAEGANIMILGSGALHDVPMEELLKGRHHITCVDIVHLPKIRRKYPDVTFLERDITGIIETFYNQVRRGEPYSGKIAFRWSPEVTPDLVISLNLLTQLPISLVNYAKRKKVALHENFASNIMAAHLSWLIALDTEILLVSDIKRAYLHKDTLVRLEQALPEFEYFVHHRPIDEWQWDIAPKGEAGFELAIEHRVGVWQF